MNRRTAAKLIGAASAAAGVLPSAGLSQVPAPGGPQNPAPGSAGASLSSRVNTANIAINQCGYRPSASKILRVALPLDAPENQAFTLETSTGEAVLRGTLTPATVDAASGDRVALADISAAQMAGTYRLRTAGTVSDPILVADTAYATALTLVTRAFYGQRCGCKVDLGGGYRHKACHTRGEFHPSSGRHGKAPSSGGWHDAGDYGRYVVNSGITTATLLWAWEMFPAVLRPLSLHLPESGGGVPDFLAEVRWNLRWMLTMQDPTDGGVWHKQTSTVFCGFILPERDTLPSDIIGTGSAPYKSTCATADFAAVMAIAARCYKPFDPAFAAVCLNAARRAYAWAQANPGVLFRNPPGITTGEYGDRSPSDELLWAAAELFRTTGDAGFREAVETALPAALTVQTPSWNSMGAFALWTYAMSGRSLAPDLRDRIAEATALAAEQRIARSRANGYGNSLDLSDYVWGSNSVAANDALLLLVADRLQPNEEARRAAFANLHYLLGGNCFGVCWVTGLGTRPFQHPHHRPSQADSIAAPWPGLLSGGPNRHGGDPVSNAMPQQPPMRMWKDDWRAYSLNEVAINWNAPLVFLLAAANSTQNA